MRDDVDGVDVGGENEQAVDAEHEHVQDRTKCCVTHPFSPLRMAFTTSLTPRLTCLCFEAVRTESVCANNGSIPIRTLLDSFMQLLEHLLLRERLSDR